MSAAAATSARDARKGGLMLDPLLLLIVLSILLLGLVMVGIGLHLHRLTAWRRSVQLREESAAAGDWRDDAGAAAVDGAHRVVREARQSPVDRRGSAADRGAGARSRPRGEGQPALGAPRCVQPAGFRSRARAGAVLDLGLFGAPRRRTAHHFWRPRAAAADRRRFLRAAAAGAGFRRRDRALRHRVRCAVSRRCAPALGTVVRAGCGQRVRPADGLRRLPHAPDHLVPGSLGACLRQWLPAHAVADRHRARRMVRRRPRRERAEAVLPAGGAHGFPIRGARRRARPHGRGWRPWRCSCCWPGACCTSRGSPRMRAWLSRRRSLRRLACGWACSR